MNRLGVVVLLLPSSDCAPVCASVQWVLPSHILCACSTMPCMGKLEPFNAKTNSDEHRKRVKLYFNANNIKTKQRQAIVITHCGMETYTLLCNLLSPVEPSEASLKIISELKGKHFLQYLHRSCKLQV